MPSLQIIYRDSARACFRPVEQVAQPVYSDIVCIEVIALPYECCCFLLEAVNCTDMASIDVITIQFKVREEQLLHCHNTLI